ncbi:MAG: tetratricopeptide repeat protein [Planctomycetota bacterium]
MNTTRICVTVLLAASAAGSAFGQSAADRLADLRAAARAEPDRTDLYLPEAELLHRLGRHREAAVAVHAAAAAHPRDAAVQQQVGDLCRVLGRRDDAIAAYRRAVELAPADIPAARKLSVTYVDAGRTVEAIRVLADAAARTSDGSASRLLVAAARLCETVGDAGNAAKAYAAALRTGGEQDGLRLRLAECLFDTGDWAGARANYAMATDAAGWDRGSTLKYALCSVRVGRPDEAVETLDRLAPAGRHAETEIFRTVCVAKAGDTARAGRLAEQVEARWPDHPRLGPMKVIAGRDFDLKGISQIALVSHVEPPKTETKREEPQPAITLTTFEVEPTAVAPSVSRRPISRNNWVLNTEPKRLGGPVLRPAVAASPRF